MSEIPTTPAMFMAYTLRATRKWEIDGPENTAVETVSCWQLPDGRLVLVEHYKHGGCDVFPQILGENTYEATKSVIEAMPNIEDNRIGRTGFKSTEQQILEEVVDRALANDWSIDVNDGEETTVTRSRDRAQILEACQSTDADTLTFWRVNHENPTKGDGLTKVGWVWLIYGNGRDLISDYSAFPEMDAFIEPICADIEKAFG